MEEFKVSVIIPAYNVEQFLQTAVASALEQPEAHEVIIIEDGSSDGTLALCHTLEKENGRIKVLRHPNGENRGPSATRNLGILTAACEWIAFLDADDFYLPGRFTVPKLKLAQDTTVDGVYEAIIQRDIYDQYGPQESSGFTSVHVDLPPEKLFISMVPVGDCGRFHCNGLVIRRSVLKKAGLFQVGLHIGEDILLWMKCAAISKLVGGRLKEAVAVVTKHEGNITKEMRVSYYLIEVYRSFLKWNDETHSLEQQQLEAVLYKYSSIWMKYLLSQKPKLVLYPSMLMFLARIVFRYPSYLMSKKLLLSLKDMTTLKKAFGKPKLPTSKF